MSFKLLAIRPLEGTDPSLLKGLKPNCIYRFYNEYDYLYDDNGKEKSFIELQEQYFNDVKNKEDDYLKLENREIVAIKRNKQLPDDFFGENINVSAIVGENGSGKSSLLELFYYLVYKFSFEAKLFPVTKSVSHNASIEAIIYLLKDNGDVIDIKCGNVDKMFQFFEYKIDKGVFRKNDSWNHYLKFDFYSVVLNYSIYGLNSNVTGEWLSSLFHKNDGYVVPIILNPYRDRGNIDINNEYLLAQSRLLLNYYILKNEVLIDDLKISRVKYQLDVMKHQEVSVYIEKFDSFNEIDILKIYKNKIDEIDNIDVLFTKFIPKDYISDLLPVLKVVIREGHRIVYHDSEFKLLNIDDKNSTYEFLPFQGEVALKLLNLIYLLKKVYKMTQNYKEYTWVKPLLFFKDEDNMKSIDKCSLSIGDFTKVLTEVYHKIFNDIYTNVKYKDYTTFLDFIKNENCTLNFQELDFLNGVFDKNFTRKLYNNLCDSFKETKELDVIIINETIHKVIIKYKREKDINLSQEDVLKLLSLRLWADMTHITFKLKQSLSYFEEGFFEKIVIVKTENDVNQLTLDIDQTYLESRTISSMPLAFVQPIVLVKKTNDIILNEFPFNQLSSGEQQIIHSILSVVYHIYNLCSVKSEYKYSNINLIFDEIELYFHPEYQRIFINNLVNSLKVINKNNDLIFNIIFSTHSPFILSDIPSQNVLKLKGGMPVVGDSINSFGANIHDLLADEFFLDKGFMGEFAKEKINSIVKFLYLKKSVNELDSNMSNTFFSETMQETFKEAKEKLSKELDVLDVKYSKEEVEQHIKLIGEPLLAVKMKEMSDIAFKEN